MTKQDVLEKSAYIEQLEQELADMTTAATGLSDMEQAPIAAGPLEAAVMPPDDMLPMENAQGQKFALKLNPQHQQHGWIFYDNHGQWVTLRRALPHEIERAKAIIEMREVLAGIPCKA